MSSLECRALDFLRASRLTAYPGRDFAASLDALEAAAPADPRLAPAVLHLRSELDEARGEFLALFEHGADRASLYETEYGRMRGMSKGPELADLNGFYRAFGLGGCDDAPELGDHVAVELEFYAVLLARQAALTETGDRGGVEIVEDARRKFLTDHLGRVAPAIAQSPGVAASAMYGPIFQWTRALVEAECATLAVTPAPLDFHQRAGEPDEALCCAAAVSPPPPTKGPDHE